MLRQVLKVKCEQHKGSNPGSQRRKGSSYSLGLHGKGSLGLPEKDRAGHPQWWGSAGRTWLPQAEQAKSHTWFFQNQKALATETRQQTPSLQQQQWTQGKREKTLFYVGTMRGLRSLERKKPPSSTQACWHQASGKTLSEVKMHRNTGS